MDVNDIRMGSPYPKKEGSPLLMRLCRAAWEPSFDPRLGDEVRERIRLEAVRAALSASVDADLDVLRRYDATVMADRFVIKAPNPLNRERSTISGELGCLVEVPRIMARASGIEMTTPDRSRTPKKGDIANPAVADWIGDIIERRMAAWAGYVDEHEVITMVNRQSGTMTWRRLLEAMPHTREHVLSVMGAQKKEPMDA